MKKNSSHQNHEALNKTLFDASKHVTVGAVYRHYKYPKRKYKVVMLAIQEDSQQVGVIYQDVARTDAPPFVRNLDSWLESVERDGETVPRFTRIDES